MTYLERLAMTWLDIFVGIGIIGIGFTAMIHVIIKYYKFIDRKEEQDEMQKWRKAMGPIEINKHENKS